MSIGPMTPTAVRAIPLRCRSDLQFVPVSPDEAGGWTVKDPLQLKYHRLEPEQFVVLKQLDGQRSLKQIQRDVLQQHPESGITLPELQQLIVDLHRKGLVLSDRTGQGESLRRRESKNRWKSVLSVFSSILSLKLPGWNAAAFLDRLLPWVRWLYHPVTITLLTVFVVSSWIVLLVNFERFRLAIPTFQQFFGWPNLIWLWATLAACKIFHEFGHGLTCHYYGRRCHEMGVILLVFTPTLYCDANDSWMIPERWPRIWIGAGGMLFESILSAIATYVWWGSEPGFIHHLALNVIFVTTFSTVVFNANPLLRYDGYYMLSDYLGIANLRQKAERMLDRWIGQWICGFTVSHDPLLPKHHQGLFVLYSLASQLYSWFVFGSILLFLYSWLKPYDLQSVGIVFATMSLLGFVMSLGMRAWRIGQTPRQGKVRWRNSIQALLISGALVAAVLLIPIPWWVEAAVMIEPEKVIHIYNPFPGRIVEQSVKPGDTVEPGQLLLQLENEQLADRARQLKDDLAKQRVTVAAAKAAQDFEELAVAEEKLTSLAEQLREAESQLLLLRITVPAETHGTIVAPDYRPAPADDEQRRKLSKWHATPLDRQNHLAWLEERSHIASIAPTDRLQALLYLPQAFRDEVSVGQAVTLQLDAIPGRLFRGQVAEMSREQVESVPVALSTKSGGPLATESLPNQEERLQEIAYAAKVSLHDEAGVLRSGMRGSARFIVSRHTAGWWLWRSLLRLFRFQL